MRRVAVQECRREGDEIKKGGSKEVRKRGKEKRQKQIKEKRKWRKLGCIKGE